MLYDEDHSDIGKDRFTVALLGALKTRKDKKLSMSSTKSFSNKKREVYSPSRKTY